MNARLSRRTAFCLITIMAASPWLAPSARAQDVVLAIKGYDPVAYFTDGHPVQGLADFEYVFENPFLEFTTVKLPSSPAVTLMYLPSQLSRGLAMNSSPTLWSLSESSA